jgi:hypothetical protein
MALLSRFQKEQALKQAGVLVPPYPVMPAGGENLGDLKAARALLAAGTSWDMEIDRLYFQMLATKEDGEQQEAVQHFMTTCESKGLTEALASLNSRVPHRYTAVYRLDGALLRNVELVDKAGEARPEFLEAVPLGTSFCQFVLRDGVFLTSNSAHDDRLEGHPYKGVMVAYHGVPIPRPEGGLFGTLCHFDVLEQPLSDAEFENLRGVARVLPAFLR